MTRAGGNRVRKSNTQPLSVRIDENRRADLDFDIAAANRIAGPHPLADTLRTARQQPESDPMAERGRERNRGHMALVVLDRRRLAESGEMGAGAQAAHAIDRFEAGKARPRRIAQGGPVRHHPTDIVLLRRSQAAEPEIARRGLAIELRPGDM